MLEAEAPELGLPDGAPGEDHDMLPSGAEGADAPDPDPDPSSEGLGVAGM